MSDSFESDSSRSSSRSSDSRYSRSGIAAPAPPPPPPPQQQPANGMTAGSGGVSGSPHTLNATNSAANTSGYAPATYPATNIGHPYPVQVPPESVPPSYDRPMSRAQPSGRRRSGSSDSDDGIGGDYTMHSRSHPAVPPDGSVVRIIKPEDFKALFHGSIAHAQSYAPPPGDGNRSRVGKKDPRSTISTPPSRSPTKMNPKQPSSSRDFIDPYRGTTFRHRINVPPQPSPSKQHGERAQTSRGSGSGDKPKKRSASKLREQVQLAQANASVRDRPSHRELDAVQQLHDTKQAMQRKEREMEQLRGELRRLEELNVRLEHSLAKGKPSESLSALHQNMDALRGRAAFQAAKIAELDEQLYDLRQRSRASRVGELEHQCAAYISENRRLSSIISEMNDITRKGGEAALLQEAQHMIRQKDTLLQQMSDKLRVARDEQRRGEAEAETWRTRWDQDHKDTEEIRKRMDELRQAPAEILRLKREIEILNNEKLETVHREERSRAGNAYEQTNVKHTLDALTRERDQLLAQLKEKERIAELQRSEIGKRNQQLEQDIQSKMASQMLEERRQGQDREFQLRQTIGDLEKKCKALEEQSMRINEQHRQELEQARVKQQQQQESLLNSMNKYEKDRMTELQRNMEDRERKLKQQQDELAAEKARWDAEVTHRQEELAHVKRSQHSMAVANPPLANSNNSAGTTVATAAVSPPPSTAPSAKLTAPTSGAAMPQAAPTPSSYPTPSNAGPTHTREHSSASNGGGGGRIATEPSHPAVPPPTKTAPPVLSSAVAPVVQAHRPEASTPVSAKKHEGLSTLALQGNNKVPRYDRGDDVQSEVTVRQANDDVSSVASSIRDAQEDAAVMASPPTVAVPPSTTQPPPTISPVKVAVPTPVVVAQPQPNRATPPTPFAAGAANAAVVPAGTQPQASAAAVPPSTSSHSSTAHATPVVVQPPHSGSPPPPSVQVVTGATPTNSPPSTITVAPVPVAIVAQQPSLGGQPVTSPAARPAPSPASPAAVKGPPVVVPVAAPIIPPPAATSNPPSSGSNTPASMSSASPPPVKVSVPLPAAAVPPVPVVAVPVVKVPVPVVAPPMMAGGAMPPPPQAGGAAPPPVSVVPVGSSSSTIPSQPMVPPATALVGIPTHAPAPVPTPTPLHAVPGTTAAATAPVIRPVVGGVAPAKKKPTIKKDDDDDDDDSEDEEFVVQENDRKKPLLPAAPADDDDLPDF